MPFVNFLPFDPDNVLLSVVIEALGHGLASRGTRLALGSAEGRALSQVLGAAIDRAIDSCAPDLAAEKRESLRKALRSGRKQHAGPESFSDLSAVVGAMAAEVNQPPSPGQPGMLDLFRIDPASLTAALKVSVAQGILENSLSGGPLHPLQMHTSFQHLVTLCETVLAEVRGLTPKIDEALRLQHRHDERQLARALAVMGAAQALIRERTQNFVGRYIISEIDAKLADPSFTSGYLLLTGEPGIGKTALLAHLVATRNYIYHFNIGLQDITSNDDFLGSVCLQLSNRLQRGPGTPVPEASSAALSALLTDGSSSATADAPLVIVIDALDESAPASGGRANRMLLPPVLPPHTYFLITSRPLTDYQLIADNRMEIEIRDDDPRNLADIGLYIQSRLAGSHSIEFQARIAAWNVSQDDFIATLTTKSEGNFMYIVHMLESIRTNRLPQAALSDITRLPQGLSSYYKMHWNVMKSSWPQPLADQYEIVIRGLATMRRPVSAELLIKIIGNKQLPDIGPAIAGRIVAEWREFLNEQSNPEYKDVKEYYFYHDTFREFLENDGPGLQLVRRSMAENVHDDFTRYVENLESQLAE